MSRIVFVLAITLLVGGPSASEYAQAPNRIPLDPAAIKSVDPLYPGFTEILQRDDPAGLVKLARTLAAHPSPESLAVLLWMLRYCPSWPNDGVLQIDKTVRAVGTLPLAPVADALLHATADQRLTAAGVLAMHGRLIPESDKTLLDKTLAAALGDSDDRVRNMAVAALRARDSAEAQAAVREYVARHSATEPKRPQLPLDVPAFPAATTALLESLDPDYRNDAGDAERASGATAARGAATVEKCDRNSRPDLVACQWRHRRLRRKHRLSAVVSRVRDPAAVSGPADMLSREAPERRALTAELFANVFALRKQPMSDVDRRRMIAALIDCLDVAHGRLRTQAVEALGRARAASAVRPIVRLLDQPGGDQYQTVSIRALAAIGTPEAVPTLERLARSGPSLAVREAAASAYIWVTKPADPGAQVRRLLWEQAGHRFGEASSPGRESGSARGLAGPGWRFDGRAARGSGAPRLVPRHEVDRADRHCTGCLTRRADSRAADLRSEHHPAHRGAFGAGRRSERARCPASAVGARRADQSIH